MVNFHSGIITYSNNKQSHFYSSKIRSIMDSNKTELITYFGSLQICNYVGI